MQMALEMVLKAAEWNGAELKAVELKAAESQLLWMGKDVIEVHVLYLNDSLRWTKTVD